MVDCSFRMFIHYINLVCRVTLRPNQIGILLQRFYTRLTVASFFNRTAVILVMLFFAVTGLRTQSCLSSNSANDLFMAVNKLDLTFATHKTTILIKILIGFCKNKNTVLIILHVKVRRIGKHQSG